MDFRNLFSKHRFGLAVVLSLIAQACFLFAFSYFQQGEAFKILPARASLAQSLLQDIDPAAPSASFRSLEAYTPVAFSDDSLQLVNDPIELLAPLFLPESPAPDTALGEPQSDLIRYQVRRGDTLARIWQQVGASENCPVQSVESALKEVGASSRTIRVGEEIEFAVDEEGSVREFRRELDEGKQLIVKASYDGTFETEVREPQVEVRQTVRSGVITQSLAADSANLGVPYDVIDDFIDFFGSRVEFNRDVHAGDSFAVVYEDRVLPDGTRLASGPIIAASFVSKGKFMAAIRHVGQDGKARYYDREGNQLGNYFLRYPVRFTRISSMFSRSRFHPVLKRNRPHNGVDFAAPTGTPVRAVADGIVEVSGYNGGAGNMVKIRHNQKYQTAYLHLHRISSDVRKGTRVQRGQVIGTVGSTGMSTGPHLHYSLYIHGQYVDPMKAELPRIADDSDGIPAGVLRTALQQLKRQHNRTQLATVEQFATVG